MPAGENQGSDVGEGDAGNQVVSFTPGAKTIGEGYHTWDHKRLSLPPFTFSLVQAQKGKPAPPRISKDDPWLANSKSRKRMFNDVTMYCREDGLLADCDECARHSVFGKKPGKPHSKGVLSVNGMPVPACPRTRFGPARIKSNRDYLIGEDPPGWARSWYPVICDPAPSQRRQKRQKRQEKQTTANDQALEPSGDVLPTPEPAGEQQVQPSNVVPASVSAPQQPLQPLNVESTVEQPQQQATGLDVQVQVMGESAEPSNPPKTQQPSDKLAMGESVGNGNNFDIPAGFVAVIALQEKQTTPNDQTLEASGDVLPTSAPAVKQPQQQASGLDALLQVMGESAQPSENDIPDGFVGVNPLQDNLSNTSNDSWESLDRFINAQPGMSLDDAV